MERLRYRNTSEFSGRRKTRRTTTAVAGGTALLAALACSPPALSTPEPIPTDVVQVEAPTCTLDYTPLTSNKYEFSVEIDNPSNLEISKVTYDFGNGVKRAVEPDASTTYTYSEGHWRPSASFNIVVPEGTRYSVESYQVFCGIADLNIPNR